MARKRLREVPAKGKHPAQTIAGYYPKTYKHVRAIVARKRTGVSVEEALAALNNAPKPPTASQRFSFFGVHTEVEGSPSDENEADVKGSAIQYGKAQQDLQGIQADVEAYKAQAAIDEWARINARYRGKVPKDVASLVKRRISLGLPNVKAYEQSLMREWAGDVMGFGYDYSVLLGVVVAK